MILRKTLLLLSVFFIPQTGWAQTLAVGLINQNRPPYFWQATDGSPPDGAYIKILERVGKASGLRFTYQFLPQARIRHYMKNQVLDIEPGIDRSWRQEPGEDEVCVYSDIFYTSKEVIVYNPSNLHRDNLTPEDFKELTPCAVLGFNNIDFDEGENHTYTQSKELLTENQMIQLLKRGRCDFAVFPIDVIRKDINTGVLTATQPVATYQLRFRISAKNKNLLPFFNAVIKEMQASGEIKKLMMQNHEDMPLQ